MNIDETAVDGIELMASFKPIDDEEKPSTEDEKEGKFEEVVEEEVEIPGEFFNHSWIITFKSRWKSMFGAKR